MGKPVRVRDAPGLIWKPLAQGKWVARWQCRSDIREKGFPVKSVKLGVFTGGPTEEEWNFLSDTCVQLQQEMLVWVRGLAETTAKFNGSLSSLMACYRTDPDSGFKKLRYQSKVFYETLMGLIDDDFGPTELSDIKARTILRWHEKWSAVDTTEVENRVKRKRGGKAGAHGKIKMLRIVFSFGATILEEAEAARIRGILSGMRFEMPRARTERLTADQANAIRAKARENGRRSIALAQAFQFEAMLRQKDVIGEWVPMNEPGMTDVIVGKEKWLRGLRWEEIDDNLVLRHLTSKRSKALTVDLKNAPMVMEELAFLGERPASGPIVAREETGRPWRTVDFRRAWRKQADACGIPKTVRNMDSRAGAISEATDAGADLEHVRHAATHSNISMTQRYSRGAEEKIVNVQKLRIESRKKGGNT